MTSNSEVKHGSPCAYIKLRDCSEDSRSQHSFHNGDEHQKQQMLLLTKKFQL